MEDAAKFKPTEKYDVWHDRPAFHFLTAERNIENYLETPYQSIKVGGILVLGTFSDLGPTKCSGIEIRQYTENSITHQLEKFFNKIRYLYIDHRTPSNTIQNFIFCAFRKSTNV